MHTGFRGYLDSRGLRVGKAGKVRCIPAGAATLLFEVAEKVGFEPTEGLHLRLISNQVHSTTLPPLQTSARVDGERPEIY